MLPDPHSDKSTGALFCVEPILQFLDSCFQTFNLGIQLVPPTDLFRCVLLRIAVGFGQRMEIGRVKCGLLLFDPFQFALRFFELPLGFGIGRRLIHIHHWPNSIIQLPFR